MNSIVLKNMIEEKFGFRNEQLYGSGVRDIRKILEFECIELGNVDILDYVQSNYYILTDVDLDEYEDMDESDKSDIVELFADKIVNESMEKLSVLNESQLYALWLTGKQDVIANYEGSECNISMFKIPSQYLILSDLGSDGSLFLFKKSHFEAINNIGDLASKYISSGKNFLNEQYGCYEGKLTGLEIEEYAMDEYFRELLQMEISKSEDVSECWWEKVSWGYELWIQF